MQLTRLSMQDEDNEKYKRTKQHNATKQTWKDTPTPTPNKIIYIYFFKYTYAKQKQQPNKTKTYKAKTIKNTNISNKSIIQ